MNSRRSKTFSKNHPNRELGIALISVLWVLLLLSGLAGAAAFMARADAILTHRLGELAQAEAAADAAIVNAISKLSDEKASRHPPIDGQSQIWKFQTIETTVSISNEAGRIDINTADDNLILAFLNSQGVSEDRATALLEDLRKSQHVSKGPAPAGSLRTVEELRWIPSWASQDLNCWSDSLTVYTGLPGVRVDDATERVRAALKWAHDNHMGDRDWTAADAGAPTVRSDQSMLGEILRIIATTSAAFGTVASREWVGRLTGDSHQSSLTMRWSRAEDVRASPCKK